MSEKEKWFTLAEAETYAGVSRNTLNTHIAKGTLKASQISDGSGRWGFHYMVSESALLDWVENRHTVKVATAPGELTVDKISDWITSQIQKAYETGYKEGMKVAKAQMKEAMKGFK